MVFFYSQEFRSSSEFLELKTCVLCETCKYAHNIRMLLLQARLRKQNHNLVVLVPSLTFSFGLQHVITKVHTRLYKF